MKNTLIFLLALSFCLSETMHTPENKPDETFRHIFNALVTLNQTPGLKYSFNIVTKCNTSTKETLEKLNTKLDNITDDENPTLQKLKKNIMEMLKYFEQGNIKVYCVSTRCKEQKPDLDGLIRKLQRINRNCSFTLPKS